MKQKAIICDLDGTLINCNHRRHFIEGEKDDWKSFLHPEHIEKDTFNEWCRELILAMDKHEYVVLFVTGRNENTRTDTTNTLLKYWYALPNEYMNKKNSVLFMRKDEDYREDAIVKEEIYKECIEPFYDVLFCIDDRKCVTDMWRNIGLVCLHCAEGNF